MNIRHKYFRNLKHKQKLEAKAGTQHTYWSHVMFTTSEPDPRDVRESYNYWIKTGATPEEAFEKYLEWERKYSRHPDRYIYYKRPEVPYSIRRYPTDPKRSKRHKFLKRRANKAVRQLWKQKGESYNNRQFKKISEIVWELD